MLTTINLILINQKLVLLALCLLSASLSLWCMYSTCTHGYVQMMNLYVIYISKEILRSECLAQENW